jgi:hypothetical protein
MPYTTQPMHRMHRMLNTLKGLETSTCGKAANGFQHHYLVSSCAGQIVADANAQIACSVIDCAVTVGAKQSLRLPDCQVHHIKA